MKLVRSLLAHFGLVRRLPTSETELRRTLPRHRDAIRKADRVLEDYRRADGVIELRVIRRPR